MSLEFIADTNILILSFAGQLKECLQPKKTGISIISEIELLSFSSLTSRDEEQLRTQLQYLFLCPLSEEIKEETIRIRRANKLKLPDAIICATALVHQATLLSNDKQLLKISGVNAHSLETH